MTTNKNSKRNSTPETQQPLQPETEVAIRTRAYTIYEERGRTDGHDIEDWLQAEDEVRGTLAMSAKAE